MSIYTRIVLIIVVAFAVLAIPTHTHAASAGRIVSVSVVSKSYDTYHMVTFADGVTCTVTRLASRTVATGAATYTDSGTWFWWVRSGTDSAGVSFYCQ